MHPEAEISLIDHESEMPCVSMQILYHKVPAFSGVPTWQIGALWKAPVQVRDCGMKYCHYDRDNSILTPTFLIHFSQSYGTGVNLQE